MMSAVYYNEMKLIKVCSRMERTGIRMNVDAIKEQRKYHIEKAEAARENFEKDTGRAFKDSPKLFKEIFDERGESYPLTEKGNPSFKAEVLENSKTSTGKLINEVRYHEKLVSTYYNNFLDLISLNDRLHPSMHQGGTTTGRFSYSNPNLQNVPKESNIRKCFIPTHFYSFLDFDYKAIEYRLLADYANEKYLINAINDGEDVHQATADLLNISRREAKTVNFGILYGCGNRTLAEMLDLNIDEAKHIRAEYYNKLPAIKKFSQAVVEIGGSRGWVKNWMGRVCRIKYKKDAYKLVNYLIQSSAADVIKTAMVNLYEADFKYPMLLQIHDSLLFEIHGSKNEAKKKISDQMVRAYKPFYGIQLEVSCERGKSWGEMIEF